MQRAGLLRQVRGVVRRILIVILERYACALRRLYCLARAYMRVSYLVHAFLCRFGGHDGLILRALRL